MLKVTIFMFNPHTSLSCNVYTRSSLDIIDYSRHVLDHGMYICQMIVLSNFLLLTLIKEQNIYRLYTENLLLSREIYNDDLVYGSGYVSTGLWVPAVFPYLTKHNNMIEKTQRSFTKYISGMQGMSYPERHNF